MTVEAAREAGEPTLADALDGLRREENWIDYAVSHFRAVQEIGAELDLPIHLWPDKLLIEKTDPPVSEWLAAWRERQSPESFAGRPTSDGPPPQPPRPISL